nr:hypothetical protein [Tanacetum cinerariifolium]
MAEVGDDILEKILIGFDVKDLIRIKGVYDYKVILGYKKSENQTCFQVLTLKSNVWKVIGDVNYSFISSNAGIIYNGALHWFMSDQNQNKVVILSFDLSLEEFKVIPQPGDAGYEFTSDTSLGIVDNCLCICRRLSQRRWVMTNYNVKQSWAILKHDNTMIMKCDIAHFLGHIPPRFFFCKDNIRWSRSGEFIGSPIFVKSLVSPHSNGRHNNKWSVKVGSNYHVISWFFLVPHSIPKRKRRAKDRKRNAKVWF